MVKDTAYYDILGVTPDVTDTDLKKAYKKKAIQFHPDKNKAEDAEETFKEISKAYQILSDGNTRALYDKNGKEMVESMGHGDVDPSAFFAKVFGGDRFYDLIGEISLMKEMTNVADVMMTDEERVEMEKEAAAAFGGAQPTPTPVSTTTATPAAEAHPAGSAADTSGSHLEKPAQPEKPADPPAASGSHVVPHSASGSATPTAEVGDKKDGAGPDRKGKAKLTPEQRKKLEDLDAARKKAMDERVDMLSKKLRERIRPFVEAKNPDDKNDPEIKAYVERTAKEADDLKLESFGVEILHTIANVYMMKATSSLKSRKFLGIPGFFSRLKEKGAAVKEAWGLISSAVGVQAVMEDMQRRQERGEEFPEEELRAMEEDLTGKILLASWRGTRFEVSGVLREVCDKVLREPGISEEILIRRAKAVLLTGAIFKAAKPDESDEERRELERLVAHASGKKDKHAKRTPGIVTPTLNASASTSTPPKEGVTTPTEGSSKSSSWFHKKA